MNKTVAKYVSAASLAGLALLALHVSGFAETATGTAKAPDFNKVFKIYTDGNSPDNHYAPSGWMGDWGDLKINAADFTTPHSGSTCLKIEYVAKRSQGANWAGIYWQNPPNNWGGRPGGYNLVGATKMVFWARVEKGGEEIY